ncbi:MAG TPA: glycoside hydrolase family 3 C-terminal domain-containing protein, partial [Sphingomonadaceae bacterium]|nr:glycoside hydrolase family 3 C-terminal domain-containing protein [Sphingomonadaceae bacterium]
LYAMFEHGLVDNPVTQAGAAIDFDGDEAVSRKAAEAGAVLLKNEGGILPLAASARRIAIIGGHADKGVISGGGSSQVYPGGGPDGGNAVPGIEPTSWPGPVVFYPSSPLEELRALMPDTEFVYHDGEDQEAAAALAASSDMALVFGTQWASESIDVPLHLDGEQDALVAAVAAANPETVVVLQTGGPVLMPWLGEVKAVLEAWYPGRMGGAAIANLLTGKVNPSGHLPVTFPASLDQLPYPGEPRSGTAIYDEGAAVGYKWFDTTGAEPLFAFGHGLSYTDFAYAHPDITNTGQGLVFSLDVTNIGDRAGADVVQVYVEGEGWEAPKRLAGFARVELQPGETRGISIPIDPRLLAVWDPDNPGWSRAAGSYTFSAGHSSRLFFGSATIELPALHLPVGWSPGDAD